jgi:flavin-dependent dehydrogenase
MKSNFEIGIIGGGPAGSAAAAYLAGYGFDVCLFEKKSFPRETLCGEFLSTEVIHFLKELNLFDEFISLNPNKIKSFRFFNHSGKSINHKFNFDVYGLSRSSFDNLLLQNTKRKGVAVFQPAEVKEIILNGKSYQLVVKKEEQKEINISVNYLIAAYGKQNALDNFLRRNFINQKSKLNGIKFHLNKNELKEFAEDEIQIYSAENIYCGVNAVDSDKVTFCFLEDRKQEQPPPRKQLIYLQKKNKAFKKLFTGNDENLFDTLTVYGTGNIFFGRRNLVENGIFMIGDAAGVIAPLAGDGISMAIESGKLIADLFYKKRYENLSTKELEFLFIYEWNKLFLSRMKTAKTIQTIILKSFRRNIGFLVVKFFPALLPYLVRTTRNTFQNKKLS